MKIVWVHNFERDISGHWMYTIFDYYKNNDSDIQIDLLYIGKIYNPISFLIKLFKFRRILRSYDIIHAQYGSGTGFFCSFYKGIKVLSLRGSDWYYYNSRNLRERLHSWLSCKLTGLCLKKYKGIIVMSERMKHEVSIKFIHADIAVIPDGINLKAFYPSEKSIDKFRILFSSVQKKNNLKRFELARDAYEIFQKSHPQSELVFMNGLPHSKVREYLCSTDVVLLTSTHEGWPNIVKEGLACNVPFVSTDVSDLKMVAKGTESCFVCKDDPVSLASGLEKVFAVKKKEDLRNIVSQFDVNISVQKIIDFYKRMISVNQ